MKIRIESQDGYKYDADTLLSGEPASVGAFVSKAGEILLDADKAFKELQQSHPLYEHMEIYPTGILLELEGSQVGIVSIVDDYPQFTPLKMQFTREND